MDKLLELLGQDLYNSVIAAIGNDKKLFLHNADQKVVIEDGVNIIPKYRFDEVIQKNKALEAQLTKADADFKALKAAAKGNDELTAQLTKLQEENKTAKAEYEAQSVKLKTSLALKEALLNAGVVDEDARELLTTKFDISTLTLDDGGKIKGADALIKPLKEHQTLSVLFKAPQIKGTRLKEGSQKDESLYTREDISAMSEADINANYDLVQKSMASWDVTK